MNILGSLVSTTSSFVGGAANLIIDHTVGAVITLLLIGKVVASIDKIVSPIILSVFIKLARFLGVNVKDPEIREGLSKIIKAVESKIPGESNEIKRQVAVRAAMLKFPDVAVSIIEKTIDSLVPDVKEGLHLVEEALK